MDATVADRLDAFRRAVPGCSLAALGDLSARLVLCASCDPKPPQERLDRLCERAAGLLLSPPLPGARLARVVSGPLAEIFIRSSVDEDDVLCCVCGPNVDISELVRRATQALGELGQRR